MLLGFLLTPTPASAYRIMIVVLEIQYLVILLGLVVVVAELLLMVLLDILTPPQGLEMREDSVQLKGMLEEMLLIGPLGTITTTLVQVEAVASPAAAPKPSGRRAPRPCSRA